MEDRIAKQLDLNNIQIFYNEEPVVDYKVMYEEERRVRLRLEEQVQQLTKIVAELTKLANGKEANLQRQQQQDSIVQQKKRQRSMDLLYNNCLEPSSKKRGLLQCTHDSCDFETRSSNDLAFHLKVHSSAKFKCPYCVYLAINMRDLRRHITKNKTHCSFVYRCQQCQDFVTNSEAEFKTHLNVHYGQFFSEENIQYLIDSLFFTKETSIWDTINSLQNNLEKENATDRQNKQLSNSKPTISGEKEAAPLTTTIELIQDAKKTKSNVIENPDFEANTHQQQQPMVLDLNSVVEMSAGMESNTSQQSETSITQANGQLNIDALQRVLQMSNITLDPNGEYYLVLGDQNDAAGNNSSTDLNDNQIQVIQEISFDPDGLTHVTLEQADPCIPESFISTTNILQDITSS